MKILDQFMSDNVIYLKNHQIKLIEMEAESLAKAVIKRLDERWLIEGVDKRNSARELFINKFQTLINESTTNSK